jgi:hypothetical protein
MCFVELWAVSIWDILLALMGDVNYFHYFLLIIDLQLTIQLQIAFQMCLVKILYRPIVAWYLYKDWNLYLRGGEDSYELFYQYKGNRILMF